MKKYILISLGIILLLVVLFAIWAVQTSFTRIKPTTEVINQKLASDIFLKIIRIPEGIQRPSYDFEKTAYTWEMETNAGEVTAVNFSYTPAFDKNSKELTAVLEMPEGGDSSIFTKVLPAVIADEQSLKSALDPEKANFGASDRARFSKLALSVNKNNQTTKIMWTIPKNNLPEDIKEEYSKLNFDAKTLKKLYSLPGFFIGLFKG